MRVQRIRFANSHFGVVSLSAAAFAPRYGTCANPQANAGPGEDHARRRDSNGAAAQSHPARSSHYDSAKPGSGNYRESASESALLGRCAVPADFLNPINSIARLPRQHRSVRSWPQLSLRARQEAPAPLAGGEGRHGGDHLDRSPITSARSRFRLRRYLSTSRPLNPRSISPSRTCRAFRTAWTSARARYQGGDISEDDYLKITSPAAAVSDRCVASAAREDPGAFRSAAFARIRIRLAGLSTSPVHSTTCRSKAKLEDLQAKALGDAPGLARRPTRRNRREQPVRSRQGERQAGRHRQINYTHVARRQAPPRFSARFSSRFSTAIRAKSRALKVAITQAQEQQKAASEQVMTDVLRRV